MEGAGRFRDAGRRAAQAAQTARGMMGIISHHRSIPASSPGTQGGKKSSVTLGPASQRSADGPLRNVHSSNAKSLWDQNQALVHQRHLDRATSSVSTTRTPTGTASVSTDTKNGEWQKPPADTERNRHHRHALTRSATAMDASVEHLEQRMAGPSFEELIRSECHGLCDRLIADHQAEMTQIHKKVFDMEEEFRLLCEEYSKICKAYDIEVPARLKKCTDLRSVVRGLMSLNRQFSPSNPLGLNRATTKTLNLQGGVAQPISHTMLKRQQTLKRGSLLSLDNSVQDPVAKHLSDCSAASHISNRSAASHVSTRSVVTIDDGHPEVSVIEDEHSADGDKDSMSGRSDDVMSDPEGLVDDEQVRLEVTVLHASASSTGLADIVPAVSTSDLRCVCRLQGTATSEWRSLAWQKVKRMKGFNPTDDIEFLVAKQNSKTNGDAVGRVVVLNDEFYPGGFEGTLGLIGSDGKQSGDIHIRIKVHGACDPQADPSRSLSKESPRPPSGWSAAPAKSILKRPADPAVSLGSVSAPFPPAPPPTNVEPPPPELLQQHQLIVDQADGTNRPKSPSKQINPVSSSSLCGEQPISYLPGEIDTSDERPSLEDVKIDPDLVKDEIDELDDLADVAELHDSPKDSDNHTAQSKGNNNGLGMALAQPSPSASSNRVSVSLMPPILTAPPAKSISAKAGFSRFSISLLPPMISEEENTVVGQVGEESIRTSKRASRMTMTDQMSEYYRASDVSIDPDQHRFKMWNCWLEANFQMMEQNRANDRANHQPKTSRGGFLHNRKSPSATPMAFDDDSDEEEDSRHRARVRHRLEGRFVIHPQSANRLFWEFFSLIVVGYDCIVIPLQFFPIGEHSGFQVIEWLVRIFWTLDLPASFITGFVRRNGSVELGAWAAASHYMRTWFVLDISVLSVDWLEVILGSVGILSAARMGKTLKSLRMIRVLRILKLSQVKQLPESLKAVEYYFRSELAEIGGGILKIFIFMVWVNHAIACCWYGLADGEDGGRNWLDEHASSRSLGYTYLTSYHWAMCQFAGTMEVSPVNITERFFAVISLLFAFFVSASVVSSITSSMTRLEIATAHVASKISSLKKYLYDNHISSKVALRVERDAQHVLAREQETRAGNSIELLGMISSSLQREVHFEIYMPRLKFHPFFDEYCGSFPSIMKQVCHNAVSQMTLMRGDMLFTEGEIPPIPHMYFMMMGKMTYSSIAYESTPATSLHAGEWCCEAVLWTPWIHCGTMRVKADCTLLVLDAEAFQSIVARSEVQGLPVYCYGSRFVKWLNTLTEEELTDLWDPCMDMVEILDYALPGRMDQTFSRIASLKKMRGSLGKVFRGQTEFSIAPSDMRR